MDDRTRIKRSPKRAVYDQQTIHAIVDASYLCHVGFVDDGMPFVIPTACWRQDNDLLIHGSRESRMIRVLQNGAPACVTITLLDGMVLARSVFNHSMNYRSVVAIGAFQTVQDKDEIDLALHTLVEKMVPGRSQDSRAGNRKELAATSVLKMSLDKASAKVRDCGLDDTRADLELPHWAGVIPFSAVAGQPVPDARSEKLEIPDYLNGYTHRSNP